MALGQLDLFENLGLFVPGDNPALWTPRDIWIRINERLLSHFGEDKRFERKGCRKIHFSELSEYYSTFSNTPDGGMVVFGVEDKGQIVGCNSLSQTQLNEIDKFHINHCPQAKPEVKRFGVIVDGKPDFCIAIYVPYIGKLVETSRGEAWIRYGDSKHKMSEAEKQDFRSTRQELSFELEVAPYQYPADFDERIIEDFCDAYRTVEGRKGWSTEEVLVDAHLVRKGDSGLVPVNALVLLAAKDPRVTIPGSRVRIQRFGTQEEGVGDSYQPLRDRTVDGNLVKIIREAADVIQGMIYDVTWLNPAGNFITTPEYPHWAWFEALVNACVHRSYSFSGTEIFVKLFTDRMEIESPGGFVPPVNERTIYTTRATRNYHLMDALRHLGRVKMAREGTRRIRESMNEWGLPEPVFRQEALHGVVVKTILRNDHISRKRATDRDVALHFGVETWKALQEHEITIAAYAFRNETIQVNDAVRLTGRTWQTSKKDLDRLVTKEILVFEPGKYPRDPKATYRILRKPASLS